MGLKRSSIALLVLAFVLISFSSEAQRRRTIEYSGFFDSYYFRGPLNISIGAGAAGYNGDLCKIFSCGKIAPTVSIGANYKLWPRVMFGADFSYLQLKGTDKIYPDRNLLFSFTGYELDVYGRLYFIDDVIRVARDRTRKPKTFKAFVSAGMGGLSFTSSGEQVSPYADTVFRLRRIYPQYTVVFPLGVGLSFTISPRVTIITDFSYRIAFTDYIDDFRMDRNDGFGTAMIKLQYSPTMPRKHKSKKGLAPPEQYDGPKGTETWKTRKPEKKQRNNDDYELPDEYQDRNSDEYQEENQDQQQNDNEAEEGSGW